MCVNEAHALQVCRRVDEWLQFSEDLVESRIILPAAFAQSREVNTERAESTIEPSRLDRHEPIHILEEEDIGQQRVLTVGLITQSIECRALIGTAAKETEQQPFELATDPRVRRRL